MAVRINLAELRSLDVNASDDGVHSQVAHVLEESIAELCDNVGKASFLASVESVQLHVSSDQLSSVVIVSCSTGTGRIDVRSQCVELKAVLVSDNVASCGSGIGSQRNSVLEDCSDNSGTS